MAKTKLRKTGLGKEYEAPVVSDEATQPRFAKAVWWKPLAAYAIDLALYGLLAYIFITSTQVYAAEGNMTYSLFMMASLLISSVYLYAVLPKFLTGQTVGRWLLKIRLEPTKKPLSYWRYFLREFMAKITMVALLIPMTLIYGAIQWISQKKRPEAIMLDELFHTTTVDLTQPLTDEQK